MELNFSSNATARNFDTHCKSDDEHVSIWTTVLSASILICVLCVAVISNVFLLIKIKRSQSGRTKWNASAWLIQTLAVLGIFNGVLNCGTGILNVLTGEWKLGEASCQFYSLMSHVTGGLWTWLLVSTCLERYYRLMCPSEHPSLFSEVNTKIMMWGAGLLLLVLYLSPVYGWGEYSHFRGKFDLAVQVTNYSTDGSPNKSPDLQSSKSQADVLNDILMVFGGYVPSFKGPLNEYKRHLIDHYQAAIRGHWFNQSSLMVTLRFPAEKYFTHFCSEFMSGKLVEQTNDILASSSLRSHLNLSTLEVDINFEKEVVTRYRQHDLLFQGCFYCGLDYTHVNKNIYTFISLSWFCSLALPYLAILYFNMRMLCSVTPEDNTLRINNSSQHDETGVIRAQSVLGLLSFCCHVPYYTVNFLFGVGITVSAPISFLSITILYTAWTLPVVFHWLGTDCDVFQRRYRSCDSISCLSYCNESREERERLRNNSTTRKRRLTNLGCIFDSSRSRTDAKISPPCETSHNLTTCESML